MRERISCSSLIIYSHLVLSVFIQRRGKWSFLFFYIIFLFLKYSIDMSRDKKGKRLILFLFSSFLFQFIQVNFCLFQLEVIQEEWNSEICNCLYLSRTFSNVHALRSYVASENYIKLFSKWIPLRRSSIRWHNSDFINLNNRVSLESVYQCFQFMRSPNLDSIVYCLQI